MEGTRKRPQTQFRDRQILYYEHKQPQYKKEKSNIGRIAFIIYYISVIVALTIAITTQSYIPLLTGVVIVSYIAFMFAINFSKYNIQIGNIALISGLIGIILLFTYNDSNLHKISLTLSLIIYSISSLITLSNAKLKEIIIQIR